MKKYIWFAGILQLLSGNIQSQIYVRPKDIPDSGTGSFKNENLALLKSSTLIFALKNGESNRKDEYEKAFAESWKYSKYKIVSYDELPGYFDDANTSFLTIGGDQTTVNSRTGSYTAMLHIYLSLWMNITGKKPGKEEKLYFGRIELFPDPNALTNTMSSSKGQIDKLYIDSSIYNWSPGYLKCSLQVLNSFITKSEPRVLYASVENKTELSKLKKDTLLIPDYIIEHFNFWEKKDNLNDAAKELMKEYPYQYRVVSDEEISNRILNSPKPVCFLLYVHSSSIKYVNIYSSANGLLYAKWETGSYHMKQKDIEKMTDIIR